MVLQTSRVGSNTVVGCQFLFLSRLFCQLEGKRQPARESISGEESSVGIYFASDKGLRLVHLLSRSVLLVCRKKEKDVVREY